MKCDRLVTIILLEKLIKAKGVIVLVGIAKEIDRLGRLVIPKDIRDRLGIKSEVEMVMTAEGLLLRSPELKLVPRDSDPQK